MNITQAQHIGRRDFQEDHYTVFHTPRFTVAAVFDGHGGDECSLAASRAFKSLWKLHEEKCARQTLTKVIDYVNHMTEWLSQGSTLSAVVVDGSTSTAVIAVLGDSPVLVRSGSTWHIGPNHNARANTVERAAAVACGACYYEGYLWAGSHGLQMSRALGDAGLPFLSRVPEIQVYHDVKYALVATDGICRDKRREYIELTELVEQRWDASALVERARGLTKDNITAILIEL